MSIKEQYWKYSSSSSYYLWESSSSVRSLLFRRIAGSTHYLYSGTHTNGAPDGKMEAETQRCRTADYGRNGYGVSGSARTDSLAIGQQTSRHQSRPANIHCPYAAGSRVYQRKTGYDVLGKDTLSFIVSILPRIGQIIMESISSLAINLFVMVFVLYFMLIGGKRWRLM